MADPRIINQYDIPQRKDKFAVFDANFLQDVPHFVRQWNLKRIVLVCSTSLYAKYDHVQKLEAKLGEKVVGKKIGVGAHSPYSDVVEIAHLLQNTDADCLLSIGSSSYNDASKIASKLANTLLPGSTDTDMEAIVDQEKGKATTNDAKVKVIQAPTSLSAAEWNGTASATNSDGKKQHFGLASHKEGAPDLIVMDPELASTAPETLWLSSGVRCVDHCIEIACNKDCKPEDQAVALAGLSKMLKGLLQYKQGIGEDRQKFVRGISEAQKGSREAIQALIVSNNTLGPSHAIGHQLGSVAGVMHGMTSCILLAPTMRYSAETWPRTREVQAKILKVFNETLGWQESNAADALTKFVEQLGLPTRLSEVGVTDQPQIEKVAEKALTDIWGGGKPQITEKEEVMKILNMVL
ncbi:Dehydroquinate synthase-like protein [Teratosphaeria nubilosa]|uniref:Dehydroquinate synthase-like protein n=1 Tax=Teratosphaeria nubilosa TaxID=161662 RepID=A0A6G1L4D5_9PEZI|nr:Dehydroquinate synthase-like protein [Teratosphaeria nubilosa]